MKIVRSPWTWMIVAVLLAALSRIVVGFTPQEALPALDVEAPGFTIDEAERTIAEVRQLLDGLDAADALALEPVIKEQYPLVDRLALPESAGALDFFIGVALFLGIGSIGALAATRSENPFGWWVLAIAVTFAAGSLGLAVTDWALRLGDDGYRLLPFEMLSTVSWAIGGVLIAPIMVVRFPNGELPSRFWRWVPWVAIAAFAVLSVAMIFAPMIAEQLAVNPLAVFDAETSIAVFVVGLGLWFLAGFGALISVLARFWTAEGEERLQLKWLAFGVLLALVLSAIANFLAASDIPDSVTGPMQFVPLFVVLPAIMIVTILRFRLYSIDIVLSKTLMVTGLLAAVGGIYVALVVGAAELFGTNQQDNIALPILAAVAIAIAFDPLRRWMTRLANRLVYGKRATPYETLAGFSSRAAELTDSQLLERIPRLLVDGTGAAAATIWVERDDYFIPEATWPAAAARQPLPTGEGFNDPDADHCLPVFHGGDLLGGLSIVTARGESLSSQETQLLDVVAAGLGLAMRNARLTAELRSQVVELETSRHRIVEAADGARRELERELDSGPQQDLVAIKVKLGPLRVKAERLGAVRTAEILEQLVGEVGGAIQAVREFASGIYPPLLEAEGLTAALKHIAGRSPMDVAVEADDLGRYGRKTEAAVYFVVMEALQNASNYDATGSVTITVSTEGDNLSFSVTDSGAGFDPVHVEAGAGLANMADRLDAVGGVLDVVSRPGEGTTVRGTIPLDQAAYAPA